MPIEHRIFKEDRLVISKHVGAVNDDEFLASYRSLYEDPSYRLCTASLVDLRCAISGVRSTGALKSIVGLLRVPLKGRQSSQKIAIVAPSDISFGLGRVFQAYSQDVSEQVKVFRDLRSAVAWLRTSTELVATFLEADDT